MGVVLVVITVSSAAVLFVHLLLCLGVVRNLVLDRARADSLAAGSRPGGPLPSGVLSIPEGSVEMIVAARDEEANLPRLLETIRAQSLGDLGVLLVDDRSADATGRLMDEFCAAVGPRARAIHLTSEPIGLTGKQAALEAGFARTTGDILLFTDADCAVPSRWAESLAGYFEDPRVGVALGRIELSDGGGFCRRFQAFVQPLINQYNLGAAGLQLPLGCFGNNMAVRRAAIQEVGGFRTIGYSVTEDSALLGAIRQTGRWKVRASTLPDATATTVPKPGWGDFIEQHTRWNAGAIFARDWPTRLSYNLICFGYLASSLLAIPLAAIDARIAIPALTSFVSVGLVGLSGALYVGRRTRFFARFIPYLTFFLFFYSFVSIRALFARRLEWRGRGYAPR